MLCIHFSSNYPKLCGQTSGTLIKVRTLTREYVFENKELLEYDTKKMNGRYYKLPYDVKKGRFIQLIFIGNHAIPFCTLRSFSDSKLRFYLDCIDREFIFKITEKNDYDIPRVGGLFYHFDKAPEIKDVSPDVRN
jgi:hypothetical protein